MHSSTKYVVLDLEMCAVPRCCKKKFNISNEIIQIGAVVLDGDYEILDEFNTFVKPKYGKLDSFISNLTGITSANINDAPLLEDAFDSFMNWIPGDNVKIVSWSDSDQIQMTKELSEKGLLNKKYTDLEPEWIDCQRLFADKMNNNRCYRLSEALIMSDVNLIGKFHDGLDDAYNTALLFKKIMTEPELKLSQYIVPAMEVSESHMTYSLGEILSKINMCSLLIS